MKVYEFGTEQEKAIAMFQCAAEPWWVFEASAILNTDISIRKRFVSERIIKYLVFLRGEQLDQLFCLHRGASKFIHECM